MNSRFEKSRSSSKTHSPPKWDARNAPRAAGALGARPAARIAGLALLELRMQRTLAVPDSVGARFVCIRVFCATVAHCSVSLKPACEKDIAGAKKPAGAAHLRGQPEDFNSGTLVILP
jgi:hypothetical protein